MSSSAEKASNVARDKAAVAACKASLGLDANACYPLPPAYKGQCDYLELELKKSMAFAVDPANAAILYDPKSSRKAKVEANQVLEDQPTFPYTSTFHALPVTRSFSLTFTHAF